MEHLLVCPRLPTPSTLKTSRFQYKRKGLCKTFVFDHHASVKPKEQEEEEEEAFTSLNIMLCGSPVGLRGVPGPVVFL